MNASPRKKVAKLNASLTQVENLRILASPFGQGLTQKTHWYQLQNEGKTNRAVQRTSILS